MCLQRLEIVNILTGTEMYPIARIHLTYDLDVILIIVFIT